MGFFNSLYVGTAGMLAQERSTAVISENIANLTTTGYKRMDTGFHELVATGKNTLNSNNSVSSMRINRIDQQGGIQNTSSTTDLAISGNGFFAVRSGDDPSAEVLYTRNGTFQPDNEGLLTNSAGFVLYGWPITNGVTASGETTDSLIAVDVDVLQTTSIATSEAEIALNLDASETVINPHTFSPPQLLPATTSAADFTRSIEVYDSNGTARNVTLEFRAVIGPMAHFSSNTGEIDLDELLVDAGGPTPGILDGDILQIDDGTNSFDITFRAAAPDASLNEVSTFEELIDMVNSFTDGSGAQLYTATRDARGELTVQANDTTASINISGSDATVLGATGLNIIADPADADYIYAPEADLLADGTANPDQSSFPSLSDSDTPNPFHWWEVSVHTIDPTDPTGTSTVEISKGLINFDGNGAINVETDGDGRALLDLGAIDFDTSDTTEDTAMTLDIANITQLSGNYDVLYTEQNGTSVGTFTGVEITSEGIVQSVFSNGQRVDSYQIALANFANPNGLERISGTAFAVTEDSGDATLYEAGLGGTGTLSVSALENSNVDISDEFSQLIVSQRAFSMNAKIITTVDEMTESLAQLKR